MPVSVTVDPNVVYLVLLLGLWMGVTAAYIPGTGVIELISIGVSVGAVVLLASLPTNWLAVLVLVVGVGGFLVMPFINRRLALIAIAGLALQALGGLFLFNGLTVSPALIAGTILLSLAYYRFLLIPVLENQHKLPAVADEGALIGARGRVVKAIDGTGIVYVAGENWSARSEQPLAAGEEIVVEDRQGLVLTVMGLKRKREELNADSIVTEEIEP